MQLWRSERCSAMELNKIYNEVLMEHNLHPENKHKLEDATCALEGVNPTCGDDITLELKINGGTVVDAAFQGVGCAISQASADIMIDLVVGRSIEEARNLCQTFLGMIKGEVTNPEKLKELEEALSLKDISHMPMRVKCAELAWRTLDEALAKQQKK